jgi:hypothetical protein
MGLDVGIIVKAPDALIADKPELTEEITGWLLGRFGHGNHLFCLPVVCSGDDIDELVILVQVHEHGARLEAAGHSIGDVHRVLAAWAFNHFDPAEGLLIETWCE